MVLEREKQLNNATSFDIIISQRSHLYREISMDTKDSPI